MKKKSWNEYLSDSNPWTNRILGIEPFTKTRNMDQIEREYNQDKYGKLVNLNCQSLEEYRHRSLQSRNISESKLMYFSLGEEIFEASFSLAYTIYYSIIQDVVARYTAGKLCELGCGYGYNFSYLSKICPLIYGGEYSNNAVEIAQELNLNIQKFNYYNLRDYEIIQPETTVLTIHSVEQLPDAKPFLEGLLIHSQKINYVIHIEPSFLPERSSLVGKMRNRYIEINDYNRNLVTLLQNQKHTEILEYHPDVIGINPLNSSNILVWRFI